MRRSAKILNIHRTTVARKLVFLAGEARKSQHLFLESIREAPLIYAQFDDVETHEHTKYKPLSITLFVTKERKILGTKVSQMPAKGLLATAALEKYGPRKDERRQGLDSLLRRFREVIDQEALLKSDQNPHYPPCLKTTFPLARHETVKGMRGCIAGQGELKKIQWDPLFSLNHTAAMLRANMNRLFRRTWCTTKCPKQLQNHLDLYTDFHNRVLVA